MIVVRGLSFNVSHIILSVLFSDFEAGGLRSLPLSPMAALMEFFHANVEIII